MRKAGGVLVLLVLLAACGPSPDLYRRLAAVEAQQTLFARDMRDVKKRLDTLEGMTEDVSGSLDRLRDDEEILYRLGRRVLMLEAKATEADEQNLRIAHLEENVQRLRKRLESEREKTRKTLMELKRRLAVLEKTAGGKRLIDAEAFEKLQRKVKDLEARQAELAAVAEELELLDRRLAALEGRLNGGSAAESRRSVGRQSVGNAGNGTFPENRTGERTREILDRAAQSLRLTPSSPVPTSENR
ncbi:hypothetical protein [Thermosulfurimonas sp. F29]|uniref:hypothetical protein n=1 Tax=Thermosulfurimonas sp. F29 TaxID=2867247 RepID=UPI001C83FD9A|nr:hypothetical protein [Thermosulfurimonas sp. F29]MBX6423359.1 hypothetical protein [Thermosulfurimonas sp. F29]